MKSNFWVFLEKLTLDWLTPLNSPSCTLTFIKKKKKKEKKYEKKKNLTANHTPNLHYSMIIYKTTNWKNKNMATNYPGHSENSDFSGRKCSLLEDLSLYRWKKLFFWFLHCSFRYQEHRPKVICPTFTFATISLGFFYFFFFFFFFLFKIFLFPSRN